MATIQVQASDIKHAFLACWDWARAKQRDVFSEL